MGRKNVAPAPSNTLDAATKGYVDGAIAAVTSSGPNPSLVIGMTNTLVVPGLWIQTDANGTPQGFWYDDHNGAAGSNSDGQVAAGQTNPLTKAGLWVVLDASSNITGINYYDGKS